MSFFWTVDLFFTTFVHFSVSLLPLHGHRLVLAHRVFCDWSIFHLCVQLFLAVDDGG